MVPIVIEKQGGNERSFDIFSRMLRERIIFISDDFNDHMASLVVAQLLFLESENAEKDIYLYINSPGGVVTSGLAIYDTMNFIKPDIVTLCMGQACSMGAFILSCGTKGKRYALPNSRIMIHQPSGGARGTTSDMQITLEETLRLKETLTSILADNCGQPYEKVLADCERDRWMGAPAAMEYGLIDKVITSASSL